MTKDPMQGQTELEAQWFFEAARRGITTREAIVSWADSKIMQMESPPYWLIELSTLQSRDIYDHASIIESQLAAKLPVESQVSLVIDALARKVIILDQAIALLCRMFFPQGKSSPEDFPDPIADLLVELDWLEIDGPLSHDFISRCNAAFANLSPC